MNPIPKAGTYQAKTNGQIVIFEAKTGSICAEIPYELTNSEIATRGTHIHVLIGKDGSPMQNNINTLKQVFPDFDGMDFFWLMYDEPEKEAESAPRDLSEFVFELVCEHVPYTPEPSEDNPDPQEVIQFRSKWLNAVGGGRAPKQAASRADIMKRFGGQLRALSSPSSSVKSVAAPKEEKKESVKTPAAKAASAPKAPPAPAAKKPTSKMIHTPITCTMEEAWEVFVGLDDIKDLSEAEAGDLWFKKLAEIHPDKDPASLTKADWCAVKVAITS